MTRYFLDTTTHIERWAGDEGRQDEVREALGTRLHATSSHALREWRHIVEGTCVEFLNLLSARPRTLGDILAQSSQGWGRSPGRRLRVLGLIAGGRASIDLDLMEIRAQTLLRHEADVLFHHQIDVVRDGSECGLARNVVRRDSKGRLEYVNPDTGSEWCKKGDSICMQDHDLGTKEDRLRAAGEALQKSADHKKMGDAAVRAASDPGQRKGKVCFGQLADTSIALECGADEVVLTTDRSYEVMAPALGLNVQRFSATPEP